MERGSSVASIRVETLLLDSVIHDLNDLRVKAKRNYKFPTSTNFWHFFLQKENN